MTFWPRADSTNLTNCSASRRSAAEALASMPMALGSSVAGSRYLTTRFLSASAAPTPAELCTSAILICPLVSACSVGPFVGWMISPFAFSLVKYCSPALTPPSLLIMPAMKG
jgi:hypothetical protein